VSPPVPVILTGTGGSAFVLTQAHSTNPLPSGTLLQVDLSEHYSLRDGSEITGTTATEEIVGYQISPSTSTNTSTSLAAYFRLVPSRDYGLSELHGGQVDIDLNLAETTAGNVALIDSSGGTVNGPGGLHLVVPPNAATGNTVLTLRPVAPASLPAGAGSRTDFVGGFDLDISAGALDPLAAYDLGLGTTVADGQEFVIGRVVQVGGQSVLQLAALGASSGGDIAVDACPAGFGGCLAGLNGSGEYAVFALPAATALVTGTVADSSGPRAGIAVTSDQLAVVSVTGASGHYVLPAPVGVTSTLTARDVTNDLSATASVAPATTDVVTIDLLLQSSPPQVVQISPANHASQVDRTATVTVTFSKAIDAATVTEASVLLLQTDSRDTSTTHDIAVRRSLSTDGTELVITPTDLLAPNTVYQLTLTSAITDAHGNPLQGSGVSGQESGAFVSDFTTAVIFKADALPPNTLRISLPDDGSGNVPPIGTVGQVFVCGGANLAAPGTAVVVQNATSQVTYTASATDANGVSGSDPSTSSGQALCDALFAGRCDTSAPGSFCAVIDAAVGDKVQVQVQDVLHNTVTLDTGNMRDERTGATVIDTTGGVVSFPADPRYQALIPDGAFAQPTIVQITPIAANGVGLDLDDTTTHPEFAALTNPALADHLALIGAVHVDLTPAGTVAQKNFDVSVPASPDAAATDQYLAAQTVTFRTNPDGSPRYELTAIDTAHFSADACASDTSKCVVLTNDSAFPGLTLGGTFGLVRAADCLGYVVGWATTGSLLAQGGYVGAALFAPVLPFSMLTTVPTRFVVPVPCNQQVNVTLFAVDDSNVDTGAGCSAGDIPATPLPPQESEGMCEVPPDQTYVMPGVLSPTHAAPTVQTTSVQDGDVDVDPLAQPQATFDGPVTVPDGSVTLTDANGNAVRGHVVVDGATVTFVPDIRLHYGSTYTLTLGGVLSLTGDPLPAQTITFTTFQPVVLQHIENVDARDVVWLNPNTFPPSANVSPCTDMIAVAEGDAFQADFLGGLRVYDVTDLSTAPAPVQLTFEGQAVTSVPTSGVDRALKFTAQPAVTLADGSSFPGPFLMSVDGPGGPDRFGAWRLWDLSQWPTVTPAVTRLINLSDDALANLSGADNPLAPPDAGVDMSQLYTFVPNDIGIPEDVASFGTEVAYVANAPNIGLQALVPSQMNPQPLSDPQVQGTLYQQGMTVRAVSTVGEGDPSRSYVLAVEQGYGRNQMLLVDPQLSSADHTPLVKATYPLPGPALSVTGLTDWPAQLIPGDATSTTPVELAIVPCVGTGLCVTAVNPAQGSFDDSLLTPGLGGVNQIRTPGGAPRGVAADPQTQLLFVADGTAGLTIIDLSTPGGSRDDDGDGIDDRVLGTVDLGGAQAEAVAVWRDAEGAMVVGVATGGNGLYVVQAQPATASQAAAPGTQPSAFKAGSSSSTSSSQPGSSSSPPACQVSFAPDPAQHYGYDRIPTRLDDHISLENDGITSVQVLLASPTGDTYWVGSNHPELFSVLPTDPLQLSGAQTTITIQAHSPQGSYNSALLQVHRRGPSGPVARSLNVEIYSEVSISPTYYRVSDPRYSSTQPAANPSLPDATAGMNDILKQAVITIPQTLAGNDALPVEYDDNGNGALDHYVNPPDPEVQKILGALSTRNGIVYVHTILLHYRVQAGPAPDTVVVDSLSDLKTGETFILGAGDGTGLPVSITAINGNQLTLSKSVSVGDGFTLSTSIAGISGIPEFVADEAGGLGDPTQQIISTMVHEVLHDPPGNLLDVSENDNVMYWRTQGQIGNMLRFHGQTVVGSLSGRPMTGAQPENQWNKIKR